MKKLFLSAALGLAGIIGFTGCSKDFNVAAPYKNVTIVYGFLDQGDTAHYIRIEKAFLDNSKSAVTMAQNADSNYYPEQDLNVVVKAINKSSNTTAYTYPLHRVDLAAEGYTKQPGTFFTQPNYAYKFTDKLDSQFRYRLVITNTVTGEVDSAETDIISNDKNAFYALNFVTANIPIDFSDTMANSIFTMSVRAPGEAYYFEGTIRLHWVNKDASGTETDHTADWNFDNTTVAPGTAGSLNLTANNLDLYYYMRSVMGLASAGATRYMDSCDIFVSAATQDYYQYKQITGNQGLGITGQDIQPNYTNLKGKNVLGLFTARATMSVYNIGFSPKTLKSFSVNSALYGVGIQSQPSDH